MGGPEATAHSSPFRAQEQATESFGENMTSLSLTVCCPPVSLPSVVLLVTSCPKSCRGTPTPQVAGPGQLPNFLSWFSPQPLSPTFPPLPSLLGVPTPTHKCR